MNKRSVLKVLLNFKYINRWVVFSSDLIISGFSSFIALLFIVYASQTNFTLHQFLLGMITAVGGSALSFILLGTYKGIIRLTVWHWEPIGRPVFTRRSISWQNTIPVA